MKHILSVLVENKPGVLARISSLFSRRAFNIDSLTVGITENSDYSRMTIVSTGNDTVIEQINKQLNKLIDVIKLVDLTSSKLKYVDREMILLKVNITSQTRSEIIELADIFRSRIVDVSDKNVIIEATGAEGKIDAIIQMFRRFGIIELTRTGKVAIQRSAI